MEKANLFGAIKALMMVIFSKIISTAKENMFGLMAEFTMDNG